MKNKWRILKIASTVIIFGFLLSFSLQRFSEAPMKDVSVNLVYPPNSEKVYFIEEKNVRKFISRFNPEQTIGKIDIPELEKEINNFPSVDSSNVYLNLNGKLNVDIVQKVPAFRLNKNGQDFYVDKKGREFPVSKNYSHPSMLVTGNVPRSEYLKLAELIDKINKDDFNRKYFIGVSKIGANYHLLTADGNYKVEIGDLENIDFKVKGFKTFVEKYLVYQAPEKYSKISVKYDNQIVTTLNPYFEENDSILAVGTKEISKVPELAALKPSAVQKKVSATKPAVKAKPKTVPKKAEVKKQETREKPKAKSAAKKTEAKATEKKK